MSFPDLSTKAGDSGETLLFCEKRVPKTDPRIRVAGQMDLTLAALGRVYAHIEDKEPLQKELCAGIVQLQRRLIMLTREVATREKHKEHFVKEQDQVSKVDVAACEELCEKVRSSLMDRGTRYDPDTVFGVKGPASAEFYTVRAFLRQAELGLWSLRKQGFTIRDPLIKLTNRAGDLLLYCAYYFDGK